MSIYETISVIAAGVSLIISGVAVYLSGRASNLNKNMFKRQGVIDLHMAWQGVNDIDSKNLIGPDIIRAANALSLTSALWNHDVIEKTILYQSYWPAFKNLYEKMTQIHDQVPGHNDTVHSLISLEITKAYDQMKDQSLKSIIQTKI